MKNRRLIYILTFAVFIAATAACKKDWLDAKPSQDLAVPTTVRDFQSLLDNTNLFNITVGGMGELSSDNFYITPATWQARNLTERYLYIWAKDIFETRTAGEWNTPYQRVLVDNIVLEGLENIPDHTTEDWKTAKGTAFFFRAFDFYGLSQVFCREYSPSAATDPGIVLRLDGNVNSPVQRATIQQTYDQVISDLRQARNLVPQTSQYKTRPSLPAVYGMLARVYLSMENYGQSEKYADSCLQLYNKLLTYSTLNASAARPFALFNDEVILHWGLTNFATFSSAIVDPALYDSYNANDLRKALFFTATKTFRNQYTGSAVPFCGLATDEILLIRAESRARNNNLSGAAEDLNTLLVKRWKQGTYQPYSFSSQDQALTVILNERRKELVMRGLRWSDLRRLNKDSRFALTLTRELSGTKYILPPGDPRYVLPIPQAETDNSGITQNPR